MRLVPCQQSAEQIYLPDYLLKTLFLDPNYVCHSELYCISVSSHNELSDFLYKLLRFARKSISIVPPSTMSGIGTKRSALDASLSQAKRSKPNSGRVLNPTSSNANGGTCQRRANKGKATTFLLGFFETQLSKGMIQLLRRYNRM